MTKQRQRDQKLRSTQPSSIQWLMTGSQNITRSVALALFGLLILGASAEAKELPNAPSAEMSSAGFVAEETIPSSPKLTTPEFKPVVDVTFGSLALISTGSTFADSYTTLFARQNWLAGKKGVCNMEVESAYLYGTHPTVGRAYAVASVKSIGSLATAYYLRKHHNRFWSAPLLANAAISLQGVTQNMIACN